MAYLVKFMPRAERDLESIYLRIHASDSEQALNWYLGLTAEIVGLRQLPHRNPITRENKSLRHLLYGRKPHVYRVIFRIRNKLRTVEVLHIRYGARRPFRSVDLG